MELEVRGLTKTFGPVTAVREVSFRAPAGQVTGLLGPNGSGKTTTLRATLGLVKPTAGTVLIGGLAYRNLPRPRRIVGAMLEATGFHPGRRARDHLRVSPPRRTCPTSGWTRCWTRSASPRPRAAGFAASRSA